MAKPALQPLIFEVYQGKTGFPHRQDRAGKFYWRLLATNCNIIADGAEGYSKRANAKQALKNLLRKLGVDITGRGWRTRLALKGVIIRDARE